LVPLSLPGLIATGKLNLDYHRRRKTNRPRSAIPVCYLKAGAAELAALNFSSTVPGGNWLSLQIIRLCWGRAQLAFAADG
jgi:hypothetical protein